MVDVKAVIAAGNSAVVAPAGHGKTELIAKVAAVGRRTLVLTHTHAGVHAVRARLKRMKVPPGQVAVDTIAGWCTRYAYSFPGAAHPPPGEPQSSADWDQLYRGTTAALSVSAIREVILASYDRILIDEYQDCTPLQHELACDLSKLVPMTVFGDPMQGIFEFAGATLDWGSVVHRAFPLLGTLDVPYRWASKNAALGQWIAETRERLIAGLPIDLLDSRIVARSSSDAFDMGVLFEGCEGRVGTSAAIHCNKGICYRLASAANGGYQAIEEVAARGLMDFAHAWDAAKTPNGKLGALVSLSDACFHKRAAAVGDPGEAIAQEQINLVAREVGAGGGVHSAVRYMSLARALSNWKIYRSGLWRDAETACAEVLAERCDTMVDAAERVKQRTSNIGRRLPTRTISTPLLLKGLEFDHVVIPDATHFLKERQAQAKLFYVAISRATQSLTIGSSSRWLQF
ncbi:UvrD-helicase domain-containing protein [Xanthomonas arboricola]|uniref:UvrD-helicase domain-containing protein n=1 Tax=Xanthomonas arboricola TaxID=56448 RepID=UPI001621FE96|nr:UvrD-helicase domain-containing protein [Xanthomonas arboricola]